MILVRGLSFAYDEAPPVLSDVYLDASAGEIVLLAGTNGSGKSTLLGLLAGLLTPDAGMVEIDGLTSPGQEKSIRKLARLVVQDADLQILGPTVGDDLALEPGTDPGAARTLAQRLGLGEAWNQPAHALSWGQKRKLCLASALLAGPRLLLLDEPFAGLDYPAALEMRRIMQDNKAAGLAQIVATHDLEPLADLADRIVVMAGGSTVLAGPPAEVLDRVREFGVRPPCAWTAGRRVASWDDGIEGGAGDGPVGP